jgi:hypothetical protein
MPTAAAPSYSYHTSWHHLPDITTLTFPVPSTGACGRELSALVVVARPEVTTLIPFSTFPVPSTARSEVAIYRELSARHAP